MKCEELRENLAAYLDGEVEGAPRQAMDQHFATCAACAAERKAQAAAWRLLDLAAPPSAVPAGFTEKVAGRARTEAGPAGRGRILRLPLPAAAAAAAVLLAAGGILVHRASRAPEESGRAPAVAEVPSEALLEDLALLESLDALEDRDLDAVDRLSALAEEDLEALGG